MLRMRARRYARLGLSHGSERRMTRRREERNPIGLQRSNPLADNMLRLFVSPEIEIRYTGRILKKQGANPEFWKFRAASQHFRYQQNAGISQSTKVIRT